MFSVFFYLFFFFFLQATRINSFFKEKLIYLAAPHLSCGTRTLSCSTWDP